MAALALTAATWSACSNDDEPTAAEQSAQSRTYTVTTTLSPRNGAATRSTMTDNGDGSISAEWQKDDQIWVGYYQVGGDYQKTTAVVTAVDPSTKAATIRVTLTNPQDDGNIYFGYPYSYYAETKNPATDQTGTLADINANFAGIEGSGQMHVSSSGVTIDPPSSMAPRMCIWKFTFTSGTSNITSDITKLVINIPENNQTYTVTPSSQSPIYVAMYGSGFSTPKSICITAVTATGVYRKAAASVTLAAGKTYTTTGFALKKAEVGKVLGADGNIYDNAAATPGGNTAVAKICYVGNDAETSPSNTAFKNGLALALEDVSDTKTWCSQTSVTCLGTQYDNSTKFNDLAGIANTDALVGHNSHTHNAASAARNYNSGTHPAGTSAWFLPSAGQWDKMIGSTGLGLSNLGLVANVSYWSSTEDGASSAWGFGSNDGYWATSGSGKGAVTIRVRACLAF